MTYEDILPEDLDDLLALPGLVIIDQRDEQARARGHLPGARAVSDELVQTLVRRRRDAPPVLVYCYHGNQSRALCEFLIHLGLSRVYNLAGGWQALAQWRGNEPRL